MAWPFNRIIRTLSRTAAWFLGVDWTEPEIEAQLEARHGATPAEAAEALPEATRGIRFRQTIQSAYARGTNVSFAQLWAIQARNVFRTAYGRLPTAAESAWAYTQPEAMLGLRVYVRGRGQWTGRYANGQVTVNVPWTARIQDVMEYVREQVQTSGWLTIFVGSEPMRAEDLHLELSGMALLQHARTTLPSPP